MADISVSSDPLLDERLGDPIEMVSRFVVRQDWYLQRTGSASLWAEVPGRWGQYQLRAEWQDESEALMVRCHLDLYLDDAIKGALEFGYTHHINRLMVLASIMNMSRIHPSEIYKWFMEMFVDSSEWVMVPNVFGMGTFADGGIFATKPYISGSSYILRMSNFKKGDWCEIVDGLYWKFIEDNKEFFAKNPRLSLMIRALEKLDKERKLRIFKAAETFIEEKTL